MHSLFTDVRAEHDGRRVWVFTHQAVIMAFRYVLESLREEELLRIDGEAPLGNCSRTTYRRGGCGALELVACGALEHLEPSSARETHEAPQVPGDGGARG